MKRSKRIILLSHCLLNANSKVEGLAEYQGALKDIVKQIIDEGIGIMQLPCPELTSCGIKRWGMTKEQYDTPFYREHCRTIFKPILQQLQNYTANGYEVIGIVGIDGSPSCGVNLTCSGNWGGELSGNPRAQEIIDAVKLVEGSGIFIEQAVKALKEYNLATPLFAVNEANPQATVAEIEKIIRGKQ